MANNRKDSNGRILPENVIQRKDGIYMWKKLINGRQYCLYANTLGEIKRKSRIAIGEIERGVYQGKQEKIRNLKKEEKENPTLNEWFMIYEKVYRQGKLKKQSLMMEHRLYMDKIANSNIGRMKIKDIKSVDIALLYNELKKDGYAYNTIRNWHKIIVGMLDMAVENDMIASNPARKAMQLKYEPTKEKEVFTEEQEKRFIEYVKNEKIKRCESYVYIYIVGFNTGMRLGEILGLTWDDINFEDNYISVNHSLTYVQNYITKEKACFSIDVPKTRNSVRKIPMTKKVRDALIELREKSKDEEKEKIVVDGYKDFVFLSNSGNLIMHTHLRLGMKRAIERFNKHEEITAKRENREPEFLPYISPHYMRHTFTTRCVEKGVNFKVLHKLLGHASINTTLSIYTHADDESMEKGINLLN